MLISLKWLNEYVDIQDKSVEELENALTMIGQEVEKIEKKYEHLETVIIAKIVEKENHPDSDHLTVCQVDTGKNVLQVVCGASNHKKGDKVALAQIGTKLSEDFIIKKGNIRSYESNGMLCSMKELGLGEEHEGIIIFPEDAPIGMSLGEYFEKDDIIFELEITPNRPDCLSYLGIARELCAYYNLNLKKEKIEINGDLIKENFDVKIDDEKLSKRYIARIVKDVKLGPSPKFIKDRLEAVGMKSINNIVDISNYIMLETGQPNHIFDLDKLEQNIVVRNAKENEKLITLDEKELELTTDDIVIASGDKAVALAGIMGGLESSVNENTKNVLIEVAHFDNIKIRKSSRKHNISSESSYRFERWVDTSKLDEVSDKIAMYMQKYAGAKECSFVIDEYKIKENTEEVVLNLEKLYNFVGKKIEKEKIIQILEKLEIKVKDNNENLILTAPSHRSDLLNAQDYYEEIIRMYGFDNIENILPRLDIKKDKIIDNTELIYALKELCASIGLKEVINYSFIPKKAIDIIDYKGKIIELENPITEDFAIMRPTLVYSLLKNCENNYNRSFNHMNFFEVSRTFVEGEEVVKLAAVLSGSTDKTIFQKEKQYDFYDIKAIAQKILEFLNIKNYNLLRSESSILHPGRSADIYIGRALIGSFGQIHPNIEEEFSLEGKSTMILEINIDEAMKYGKNNIKYKSISKYQSVTRDLAFLVRKDVLIGNVVKLVEKIDKNIQKVSLFDVYQGPGVDENYKSFAISIILRDDNRTLEEKDINDIIKKIIDKVSKEFGANIRG